MADRNEASEAGRALIAGRWGPAGTRELARSANIVIDRADQLPADLREQVHQATAPPGGEDGAGVR
jgi:hypothetical protein